MTPQPVQEPAIHVQDLAKSYKQLHVLRGVSFDVAKCSILPSWAPTEPAKPPW